MPSISDIVIRPAQREDIQPIVSFSLAMASETEGLRLDETTLRQGTLSLLEQPAHGFFVVAEASQDGIRQLVGQMMITFEWSDWRNARFWWIQSVYVTPAWRRLGIYRRMHETVVARAKNDPDVCGIRLYVERHNHTAQLVYQRVGLSLSAYTVFEQDFVLPARSSPTKNT